MICIFIKMIVKKLRWISWKILYISLFLDFFIKEIFERKEWFARLINNLVLCFYIEIKDFLVIG